MENSHLSNKVSRIRWADFSDSSSSTEGGTETDSVNFMTLVHPETAILKETLETLEAPVTIYFNNLPFNLTESGPVLQFLQLSPEENTLVSIKIVGNNGKFSGRAEVALESKELALKIIDLHGHFLNERPVFMNLDGFYGRGQQYRKLMHNGPKKNRPNKNKPRRRRNRNRRSPLKNRNDYDEDSEHYKLPEL